MQQHVRPENPSSPGEIRVAFSREHRGYSLSSCEGQPRQSHSAPLCPCPQEQQDAGHLQVPPPGWLLGALQCVAVLGCSATGQSHPSAVVLPVADLNNRAGFSACSCSPCSQLATPVGEQVPCCSSTADKSHWLGLCLTLLP